MLVIDSEPFYRQLRSELDQLLAQSAPVGQDNRYLSQNSVEILPVSVSKKIIMGLVSIFSNLFRFLI